MRVNLFVYRGMDDPWLRLMREAPQQTLFALMPGLRHLTGDFEVTSVIKIRPIDLYETQGHRQAGLVVVGDAFATSCPAAGTGALRKVMGRAAPQSILARTAGGYVHCANQHLGLECRWLSKSIEKEAA